MKYPKVNIYVIPVRVDKEGRYSLNDLHIAAIAKGKATESQRPCEFLKSKQIKLFAQSLTEAKIVASVKTVKGGNNQGSWGLELIAIRYAAWLNPDFEIKVYETFRDFVMHGFDAMYRLNQLDLTINSESKEIS
uniref:KilA-N domain-containing protein n=1 Tax=Arsenophonus endosymbiont of Trialeurodes vaporariorum TaxID=235567 RepID=A0A3B0M120_9GAMM